MKTAGTGKKKAPDKKIGTGSNTPPQKKKAPVDLLLDFARKNIAPVIDQGGRSFQIAGVPETSRAFFAAALSRLLEKDKDPRPVLVVCPTQTEAEALAAESLLVLPSERVGFFPGYAGIAYESAGVSAEICQERSRFLYRALTGGFKLGFVSVEALLRLLPAADRMEKSGIEIRENQKIGPIREHLISMGYEFNELVDVPGEFCVKGSIIDIYPLNADAPVRIDLFDDEVETIRSFDPMTQKSLDRMTSCVVLPAGEIVLSVDETKNLLRLLTSMPSVLERPEWTARISDGPHQITLLHAEGLQDLFPLVLPTATLLDYFTTPPLVVLFEPAAVDEAILRVRREYATLYDREHTERICLPPDKLLTAEHTAPWGDGPVLSAPLFAPSAETEDGEASIVPLAGVRRIEGFGGRMRAVREAIGRVIAEGGTVVITSPYQAQLNRIATLFHAKPVEKAGEAAAPAIEARIVEPPFEFHAEPGLTLVRSAQRKGFSLPDFSFFLWSDNDVFGRSYRRQTRFKKAQSSPLESFLDLKEGDHVVHVNHGIGRFVRLERVKAAGRERDFLVIEYADQDKLFVPLDQISMVQKYIAPVEKPRLDSLGRASFKKIREKVAAKIEEFAEELLATYAVRASQKGFAFPPDTAWQEEFEAEFPFEETPDQITAIDAVKKDMETIRPMDRLICGDVGYGKTEVAIRGAFKCVMAGRQAAVIAPTTILALQHFQTISERFKNYPISVDWISRFRTRAEVNEVKDRLRKGDLDVVVGTHALLAGDVNIKNLGLLVVDEEQRFGVVHKEAIKKMRKMVDVLTLSATPIPRTLHMSLVGIRDLSIIQTPPRDRLPVETFVTEDSDSLLKEALRRELERDGQVFFLHNRIESIELAAKRVTDMFPDVSVAVLHGQMAEEEIEDVLLDFTERRYDVLVTTAIIENGIDLPNVNTLIVDRADTFGLSQLYQIRGRVGRASRQAYAYLFYPKGRLLTEEAQKRLHAIMEYQELGSGFKVAMRDLEIRGAGNIFGREQSGHIIDVGYELYVKMLEETVRRLQGAVHEIEVRTSINLNADFFLPADYIVDTRQRIELYKRFEGAQELAEVESLAVEMEERFGEAPEAAGSFVRIEKIRTLASRAGFESVYEEDGGRVHMKAGETFRVSRDHLVKVLREDTRLKVLAGSADTLFIEPQGPPAGRMEEILSILKELVEV